ncbi:MAG: DNA polymerase [Candidatus Nomurabacteria bacterium]|nr:DNA polymerase [Candidatus Nomurabacteria bacterium]
MVKMLYLYLMAKNTTKTLVLLDSHAIIHRAYHALPDFVSSTGEPTGALYGMANMIMKIISDLKPDYIVACYDLPQKTFRHEAYKEYKAGRAKSDDALISQLKSSRQIFEAFNIPIYDAPGFEADDILGTIVEQINHPLPTSPLAKREENFKIIIASGDMDTMQLVDDKKVQVYTLKKGITDTILYDEDAVVSRFNFKPLLLPDYKGLRGDPSDNIIGIKGIGEKTATDLIMNFGTIENLYKVLKKNPEELEKVGIKARIIQLLKDNEEEAIFSKTLATIRRDAPIDFKLPEKTFWESADLSKIERVFADFEFRSLFGRLKSFFNKGEQETGLSEFAKDLKNNETEKSTEVVDETELQETSVALWLINSEITNPTLDDILLFSKTKYFKTAKDFIFEKLKKENLTLVYEEIEKPVIPIVKAMQDIGILVDQEYFKKLSAEYHIELDKLTKAIYAIAEMEFNINSPKQLAEVLFEKMGIKSPKKKSASGSYSTNISVLEELEEENPIISEIMKYRELQKLLSTYIDVIPQMVGEDSRLHAKFIQNGTTTGRFSSQDPNLQNLPIKSDLGQRIRGGFVAQKGYKLTAFDYSQIELRVTAMLSGDHKMTEIFKEGEDIHSGVASFVFGMPIEKVDKEMRRKAKVINFGIIYGMGVSSLRKNLGGTRQEAQIFYDNYFKQFSRIQEYMEEVKIFAKEHGYTETLFGRRRMFPMINSRIPFIQSMALRTATNAPIQGTATADIIKLAIRFANEDLAKAGLLDKARLVLQIHDELVFEIEESVLEKSEKIILSAMQGVLERSFLHYKCDIPLEVHYGSGDNFGEVK